MFDSMANRQKNMHKQMSALVPKGFGSKSDSLTVAAVMSDPFANDPFFSDKGFGMGGSMFGDMDQMVS